MTNQIQMLKCLNAQPGKQSAIKRFKYSKGKRVTKWRQQTTSKADGKVGALSFDIHLVFDKKFLEKLLAVVFKMSWEL